MSVGDNHSVVTDEERLYRSVKLCAGNFTDGSVDRRRLSSQAFADRSLKISMFRAALCINPPWGKPPRLNLDDAILDFSCGEVRQLGPINHQVEHKETQEYSIMVSPDVSGGQHVSHCLVHGNPAIERQGVFRKLKEKFTLLANDGRHWAIRPPDMYI